MGVAYSQDLRDRVMAAVDGGLSVYAAAPLFRVSVSYICNLSSHRVEGVRTAIENAGACLLYLPAYSPDLNPIEQWFAKLKALLRKAAARTFNALIDAIASALETFTPHECANYLANSGYRRQ